MRSGRKTLQYKKAAASLMAGITFVMAAAAPAHAAAPAVTVDETMYVNLDYYGTQTQVNVVKACSTNGVTAYTDYGTYEKVSNMTDKTEPILGAGTVTWQFPAENRRFYYQGTLPENSVTLPWQFDVSYKLNGLDTEASKLAGASGLVEIHITAAPVPGAKDYYRNNMLLSVVVPVDMEKCYSVDAPGSQLQTAGNHTMAIFAALPGEAGEYTVRIGTDSFESVGVIMMMVPGTLDALQNLKEVKEAKDTWRADGDRLYDGMDRLLETMETMKTDVEQVQGGLSSLENARASVSENRKAIEQLSAQSIADLSLVTEQTAALIPYLDTASHAVSDLNKNANTLSLTMQDTGEKLDRLYDRLGALKGTLEDMSQSMEAGGQSTQRETLAEEAAQTADEINELLASLKPLLTDGRGVSDLSKEELSRLNESLTAADGFRYEREENRGPSGMPGSGGVSTADFDVWSDEAIETRAGETEELLHSLKETGYQESVADMLEQVDSLLTGGDLIWEQAGALIERVNEICGLAGQTGHRTAQTLGALKGVTNELIRLLDDTAGMMDTMDRYVPSILDSLGAARSLMEGLTKAMGSTRDMLSLVQETMTAAGDSLDAGTKDSLNGLNQMLSKSRTLLDRVTDVRTAGEGMKSTMDSQLDKFEEENRFLNLNPDAPMQSFTSDKNPSPRSLQILVRTDEISLDSGDGNAADLEAASAEAELTPLARMWRVIREMFYAVVSIFRNR